ncbi:MAG: ABC transporter substrate-binding protein [Leifsonia sp.]
MTLLSRISKGTAVVAVVALATVLTACTGGQSPTSTSSGPTTLRVAAEATGPFTDQFNPYLHASIGASGHSLQAIYEPLMMVDYASSTTIPWLAKKATWNGDGTKLTVDLQPGVKWSDGTAFTAQDVAYSFDLMEKYKALNFYGLPLKSATASGASTVTVDFTRPAFQSLWFLTKPVQQKQWSSVTDPVTFTNPNPVGTGPYAFKSFTPQVITLQKNASYWQKGSPKVDTVQYLSYDSESSMDAAIEGKQVDWITSSNTDPATVTATSPKSLGSYIADLGVAIYLIPNAATGPTADPALRKAISQAVNRPVVAKASFGPGAIPAKNVTGLDGSPNLIASKYKNETFGSGSAAKAKATLKAAGYKPGSNGYFVTPQGQPLSIAFTVPASATYGDWTKSATLLTSELKDAGIQIVTKTEAAQAWRSDTATGRFEMTIRASGGTGSVYDSLTRLVSQPVPPLGSNAVVNWERYNNTKAAALLGQMAASNTGSAIYAKAIGGIQEMLVNDSPVIPLGFAAAVGIWRTDTFTGWPSASSSYALPIGSNPGAAAILAKVSPVG